MESCGLGLTVGAATALAVAVASSAADVSVPYSARNSMKYSVLPVSPVMVYARSSWRSVSGSPASVLSGTSSHVAPESQTPSPGAADPCS